MARNDGKYVFDPLTGCRKGKTADGRTVWSFGGDR